MEDRGACLHHVCTVRIHPRNAHARLESGHNSSANSNVRSNVRSSVRSNVRTEFSRLDLGSLLLVGGWCHDRGRGRCCHVCVCVFVYILLVVVMPLSWSWSWSWSWSPSLSSWSLLSCLHFSHVCLQVRLDSSHFTEDTVRELVATCYGDSLEVDDIIRRYIFIQKNRTIPFGRCAMSRSSRSCSSSMQPTSSASRCHFKFFRFSHSWACATGDCRDLPGGTGKTDDS